MNELSAYLDAGYTDLVAVVLNPNNPAQARDVQAAAWAAYDPTDPDQQVALSVVLPAGTGREAHFGDLPEGLGRARYAYHVFSGAGEPLGDGAWTSPSIGGTANYLSKLPDLASNFVSKLGDRSTASNRGTTLRLTAGTSPLVAIDCAALLGSREHLHDVGLPASSSPGDVAVVALDGTYGVNGKFAGCALDLSDATAGETVEISFLVEIQPGRTELAVIPVLVIAGA